MKDVLKTVAIAEMIFGGCLLIKGDGEGIVRLLGFVGAQLLIGIAVYIYYSFLVKRKN